MSLLRLGVAVVEAAGDGPTTLRRSFWWVGRPSTPFWDRLEEVLWRVSRMMELYTPDVVVVEALRLFHRGRIPFPALRTLGCLSGAIGWEARRRGIRRVEEPHVSHWRKVLLGNGKATKDDVQRWVMSTFGVTPETVDEAEAVALAAYGIRMLGVGEKEPYDGRTRSED